jgi:2',3'-cyclic-nucleotide 2'-phosphodiesterase (5'-nucleotidase family)
MDVTPLRTDSAMSRSLRPTPPWLLLGALLAAACAPAAPPASAPTEVPPRARIVHVNDFHGRLEAQRTSTFGERLLGGAAALAAHVDSARTRFDGPTFLLSAGDMFQGSAVSNFSYGRATVDVMNRSRYDAAALGNHEFDWGLDTLRARVSESSFPWLAANVFTAGTEGHPEWIEPWVMLERGGVRLAVIGLALPGTPDVTLAGRTAGLDFRPAPPYVDRYARAAREAGADFVVVAAHIGARCDDQALLALPETPTTGCHGEILEIAEALSEPVDLILGGHEHQRTVIVHAGVPISQAYLYGMAISVTDLERREGARAVRQQKVRLTYVDQVDPDTAVAARVAYWDAAVAPVVGRYVADFAEEMPRGGDEYPLGNLIADAQRHATGAHLAIMNNGGIRRGMPAGPITLGMLFELQPFQNEMVTVEMSGALLRAALEHALGDDPRLRVHVSGMTVTVDPSAAPGSRVRQMRRDDGRIIEDRDVLTVATSEFIATGGDRFTMFTEGRQTRTGMEDLEVLVSYLQSLPQPVRPPTAARIRPVR